jgi:sulfatase modifying factor 1
MHMTRGRRSALITPSMRLHALTSMVIMASLAGCNHAPHCSSAVKVSDRIEGQGVASWADVIEFEPDPAIVKDAALREAILSQRLPWRVRHRSTGIEMLLIPPGIFVMGKSRGDISSQASELPAHEVTLTRPFYLGRYEVTLSQYASYLDLNRPSFVPTVEGLMKDGATRSEAEREIRGLTQQSPIRQPQPAPHLGGNSWPVTRLSWFECVDFCQGSGLRLPTEAEWEYACRAGTRTPRYGDPDEIAWSASNHLGVPSLVGKKSPNLLGLHDMLGNVGEWVMDKYGDYSAEAQSDPQGPSRALMGRVIRGGSCADDPSYIRSSARRPGPANLKLMNVGFRVARNP